MSSEKMGTSKKEVALKASSPPSRVGYAHQNFEGQGRAFGQSAFGGSRPRFGALRSVSYLPLRDQRHRPLSPDAQLRQPLQIGYRGGEDRLQRDLDRPPVPLPPRPVAALRLSVLPLDLVELPLHPVSQLLPSHPGDHLGFAEVAEGTPAPLGVPQFARHEALHLVQARPTVASRQGLQQPLLLHDAPDRRDELPGGPCFRGNRHSEHFCGWQKKGLTAHPCSNNDSCAMTTLSGRRCHPPHPEAITPASIGQQAVRPIRQSPFQLGTTGFVAARARGLPLASPRGPRAPNSRWGRVRGSA